MTIVRSLLVQVGFQADKKSQNSIEKSTEKVKNTATQAGEQLDNVDKKTKKVSKTWYQANKRSIALWTSALYGAKRFLSAINNISQSIVSDDILARSLNLTRNELIALNRTAKDFGFNEGDFIGVVDKFNTRIENAKRGLDSFQDVNNLLKINLNINQSAFQNILKIIERIGQISNESTRKQLFNQVFGGFGIQFSDLSQDLPNFEKNFQNLLNVRNSQIRDNIDELKKYNSAVATLSLTFNDFVQNLAVNLVPFINKLNSVLSFFNGQNEEFFKKASQGQTFQTQVAPMLGRSILNSSGFVTNVTVNNDINLPVGSAEQQAILLNAETERLAKQASWDVWNGIQSDYPRIE